MKPEQERVKTVLTDTIALLCKSGLSYKRELKVEAVIGVTVDETDVFIVHINEAFSPQNASSSTPSAEASMAVVPFSPQTKREAPQTFTSRTPSSGVKRMKAESMPPMLSSADLPRQHAKQQLRFPSPAKMNPGSGGSMPGGPGLPIHAPGAVPAPHVPGMRRGSGAARLRRGTAGRGGLTMGHRGGGLAGHAGPHGMGASRPRATRGGRVRGLPRQPLPRQQLPGDQRPSYDVKFSPSKPPPPLSFVAPRMSSPATSAAGHSSVPGSFNFTAYPHIPATSAFSTAAAAANDAHQNAADLPAFSASDHDRFLNVMPSGFGFDTVFPSDNSSSSSSNIQPGSFADINPSLEFGFLSGFNASSASGTGGGGGFATSSSNAEQSVSSSENAIKTESMDDDVILVDDDPVDPTAGTDTGNGNGDDAVAGAAVQQITRRVTITTNIQGQNVKYEQVCPAASFLQSLNDSTLSLLNECCTCCFALFYRYDRSLNLNLICQA